MLRVLLHPEWLRSGMRSIKNSRLGCNALDLVAEAFGGVAANLLDEGGNSCGCTEPVSCIALAAGIEPPDAVE